MIFPPLLTGRLERRYKRFLADVVLNDGTRVTAHCPNPGSMKTCAPENAPVWLSVSDNPRRKLAHTWELVESGGALVCVNTAWANRLVAEALENGTVAELAGYDRWRAEVPYGERSRVDFLLEGPGGACYLEVKNVTLDDGGGSSAFPDSVTARGAKHLRELARVREGGARAVLLFVSTRADTRRIRTADEIDPAYGEALRDAVSRGVEVLAYRSDVSLDGMRVAGRVPLDLPTRPPKP